MYAGVIVNINAVYFLRQGIRKYRPNLTVIHRTQETTRKV